MGTGCAKSYFRSCACVLRGLYQGQDGRKTVAVIQRLSQHHALLLGGHDGTSGISAGRTGRVLKGARACQYRAHYVGQDAYIVSLGSQCVYAAACGRRHFVAYERKRSGYRKHGRTAERGVYHRAGRTIHAAQICYAVHYADVQRTGRKSEPEQPQRTDGYGGAEKECVLHS